MPKKFPKVTQSDEVVISGIAGRFPESDNVSHLQRNLFNKVDLITDNDRRWKAGRMDIPHRTGKVDNIEKFDAGFFEIHFKEAHTMDPMARMLMEHAYEAIIDAGVNPRRLRGTNTGVFLGICQSASERELLYNTRVEGGNGITGCSRGVMANRISTWLGCTGPSYAVDTACSSSLFAMDKAYRAIMSGECDAALVMGSNLCLNPQVSMLFFLLGVLSADGCCKSFDADAKGYCRSEAVSVIYLQKVKDAKRAYAQVVYMKTNCDGFKEEGITFPSSTMQKALLRTFYQECGVSPSSLAWVEAHGTGTVVGDPVEIEAVEEVFCPGRTTPLRIGSVKSNMGHSEPASGLCSIAKVIIAMESGYIPPNIHYTRPQDNIEALKNGKIEVITETTPWDGGYVGINSFGFGGGNAHVLLKSNPKEKINHGAPSDTMPRLVVTSGRTEEAVLTLLDDLESRPVDVEYVALFHNIHAEEIPGHPFRGYIIVPPFGLPENSVRDIQPYRYVNRPVCFVFPGPGSQLAGICADLSKIPAFAKAIEKCDAILQPCGLNIIDILSCRDPQVFHNTLNSFVGTAAIQIGLVDVLATIGITSDITVGYSIGELGCAYASGCLTAKQVILAAYFQGLAFARPQKIHGSMAEIGLSGKELQSACPADVDIACYNSSGSSTISGPTASVEAFVSTMKAKDISATIEPYCNVAYHSRYVASVGPELRACLREVIPNPKPRSTKWLSTSIPSDEWNVGPDQLCSSEYLAHTFLRPVLFEQTFYSVPNEAITIEIGPHGLLQSSPSIPSQTDIINIALTNRAHENHVEFLLQAIGKLYEAGLHPQLTNLYPEIEYPISRATPMISPLLRWDHSEDWCVMYAAEQGIFDSGVRTVAITPRDDTMEWMVGHVIDGRNLLPATGYLHMIWETFAMLQGKLPSEVPIVFENVSFLRATTIPKRNLIELELMIQRGSGRFEIMEGGVSIVTGFVRTISKPTQERAYTKRISNDSEKLDLTHKDIYKELRLRGYQYSGVFRGLKGASIDGTRGRIAWKGNWVAFMDNMLQAKLLGIDTRGLFVPTGIQKLVIDTNMHANQLLAMPDDEKEFTVIVDKDLDIIVSGGVEIRGLKANAIARRKPAGDPVIEDFKFLAHRDRAEMELSDATQVAVHIALENMFSTKTKTIELISDTSVSSENFSSLHIRQILGNIPLLQADVNIIASGLPDDVVPSDIRVLEPKALAVEAGAFLAISHGLFASKDTGTLISLKATVMDGGFLLAREPLDTDIVAATRSNGLDIVLEKRTHHELVILLRKNQIHNITTVIHVNDTEFSWLETLQTAIKSESEQVNGRASRRILLVSEGHYESGLLGLVNCLRREPGGDLIQGLLIQDQEAPQFSLENAFYLEQLKLGLSLNVLRPRKSWGTYRFLPLKPLEPIPVHHARIQQHTRGDLTSMQWVEGAIQPGCNNQNIVQIHYSSINFRDVMLGTGKLAIEVVAKTRQAQETAIGFEFSGRDSNGRAIMGIIENGALSNLCISKRDLAWEVPDDWTLEDAATVPAVYCTAYYALVISGRMKKGDKVLIHAGSGGVGQAAIVLALHTGCEVFTTVGTPQKREFINNQFPQINDDHIGNSRDTSFEQLVLRKTKGRGVDIVLNSLAEEKLQASVRCLAIGGRFLEIGKFDLAANNPLGLEAFLKGISFHGVLLDNLFNASREKQSKLATMLTQGIKSGAVKPLVRTVFPMDQTEAAFRYMAAGKHIGKVIVKIRDDDDRALSQSNLALPRYQCLEQCSYLLLGGLGGFGLELADWLVLRGAKKLVFTSRKGISNGYQRSRINIWKSYGVAVVIIAGQDASTQDGCEAIIKEATALGPVRAIFNLAVILQDALFDNQTATTFEESLRVKAWATKQIDKSSRKLCPDLKHFVVFSSVSCGRGNAGQTNYGMANSIMERICETRVAEGFPGLAIQWGAIGDVGLVADMQEDNKELVIGGTLQQRISSCLQVLDGFLQQNSTVVSSMVVAEKKAGGAGATNVVDTVLNIMGLKDLKTISLQTPLAELGMDSMMGVEIKQTLERDFEVFLTPVDIRSLNFAKLIEMSEKQATDKSELKHDVPNDAGDFTIFRLLFLNISKTLQLMDETCVPSKTESQIAGDEIFLLPGIEGTHTAFDSLAKKLKSSATCLQLGSGQANFMTIQEMAEFFIPHIKARSTDLNDFVITGYSFGSLIAIELVRCLESEGLSGRLILIDGSPQYYKKLLGPIFNVEENQAQCSLLLAMMHGIESSLVSGLAEELQNCDTWEKKLTAFAKNTPEVWKSAFSENEQIAMCSAIYGRISAIRNYDSSALLPIKTPITLIKPKVQIINSEDSSEDYDLGSVTQGGVRTYYAEGDHLSMLSDDICAAIINGEPIE